jgi:hypothetical protein
MALLLGLTGPSTKPGPRLPSPPKDTRKPGQGWNLPGYKDDNDEDPDSWCCTFLSTHSFSCLGAKAHEQVYVIKMLKLFVLDAREIRIVRNVGLRDMLGKDIGQRGLQGREVGKLSVLELVNTLCSRSDLLHRPVF